MRVIELTEETPSTLGPTELSQEEALVVHKRFGAQVAVSFPTVLTKNRFELRLSGYVGQLLVSSDLLIRIAPMICPSSAGVFRLHQPFGECFAAVRRCGASMMSTRQTCRIIAY
jgi:hypothetical protein